MNGAEVILKTAASAGVDVCFANAGTTEMPIVVAFDEMPTIRPILGLFEGVCTGAADGYGRMKNKPAMTLLHLGPGLGNGIANLHNARRAHSPVFNVVGDHASWHLSSDAPLTMDIAALSNTVSGWQRINRSTENLSQDTADAITAALYSQVSTLIVPNDFQWSEYPDPGLAKVNFSLDPIDRHRIEVAARALKTARKPAIIMNGRGLREQGLKAAGRIKALTGWDLLSVMFPAYMDRGAGLPAPVRIPYFPEQAIPLLLPYDTVILAGADAPVAFFGYRNGKSSLLSESVNALRIDTDRQNTIEALEALADALGAPARGADVRAVYARYRVPDMPLGKLTAEKACTTVAALHPENAIMVEEGLTSTGTYFPIAANLAPHAYITITGGAIGQGMPCATGTAVACPDRPVINLQADGSAMYTLQALWTQAREQLNVTTLICSNRSYLILQAELMRAGHTSAGPKVLSLTDLRNPAIDWVQLSQGMGVPGVSVETCEHLAKELKIALQEPGPHLIEMILG